MRRILTNTKRCICLALAALLMLGAFAAVGVNAADGFSGAGQGTVKDPYLVTNAQQLGEMANNLSAHYKLANTIDMADVAFTPIGYLAKPFTGSFTCDLGEDGAPLYAIKNLTYHNDAGDKNGHLDNDSHYPEYKKNESHWEAGLFGATQNATITNIYVLDAKISNSVIGQHQQNANGSWNPGMDENNAAILIGQGDNTRVTGCYVTGSLDSKANGSGALVGRAIGCIIKNSTAVATVKTNGLWSNGGLIGSITDGTIVDGCSFTGDIAINGREVYNIGGLIGSADKDCKVTNCWADGTISSGNSFITHELGNDGLKKVVENNYSLIKVATRTNATTAKTGVNNCWVTDEVGGMQLFFGAASNEKLLEQFAGLDAWVTEGVERPVLKNAPVVRTADSYVVGEVVQPQPTEPEATEPEVTQPSASEQPEETAPVTVPGNDISQNIDITNNGNSAEKALVMTLVTMIAVLLIATAVILVLNVVFMAKHRKNKGKG